MKYILKYCNIFYKLASNQLKLPIEEIETTNSKELLESWINHDEYLKLNQAIKLLSELKISTKLIGRKPWGMLFIYNGEDYIIELESWPISANMEADVSTTKDFMNNLISRGDTYDFAKYIGTDITEDFNKDFWDSPQTIYHATDKNNLDEIKENGLEGRAKTRGMSNRSVGGAVFCSFNPEAINIYGDTILEIDTKAMKQDGFTPYVFQEPDVVESEMLGSIAHMLQLDDWEYEAEQGMDSDTIIVSQDIPAKYITFPEE